jgi:hypothetical protein
MDQRGEGQKESDQECEVDSSALQSAVSTGFQRLGLQFADAGIEAFQNKGLLFTIVLISWLRSKIGFPASRETFQHYFSHG